MAYEHLFLSFIYHGIGSKCNSIAINVPLSPRVYYPVLHIGDHARLRGYYYCDHVCLCQIWLWVCLLSSLPMVTLSCMVTKFTTDKAITPLFNGWVLSLVCCIRLGLRVLFSGSTVFWLGFFFYNISLRGHLFNFLSLVLISALFLNPNMDYHIF